MLTLFLFVLDTGNKEWFLKLDSVFAKELNKTKERDFTVRGDKAGSLISVGAGAGNYTFLEVYEAGHMVCCFALSLAHLKASIDG